MQIRYRYYNALCNTCKSTWSTSCLKQSQYSSFYCVKVNAFQMFKLYLRPW